MADQAPSKKRARAIDGECEAGVDKVAKLPSAAWSLATKPAPPTGETSATNLVGMARFCCSSGYADVTLVTEDECIPAHRVVLDVIPFFRGAFGTGALMMEGGAGTKTMEIRLRTPHTSIVALLRFVYGLGLVEADKRSPGELMALIDDCAIYAYSPFLEAVWREVRTRKLSSAERLLSLSLGAAHSLPLLACWSDVELIGEMSYDVVHYFVTAGPLVVSEDASRYISAWAIACRWIQAHTCPLLLKALFAMQVRGPLVVSSEQQNEALLAACGAAREIVKASERNLLLAYKDVPSLAVRAFVIEGLVGTQPLSLSSPNIFALASASGKL
jgi:hypothetical protein